MRGAVLAVAFVLVLSTGASAELGRDDQRTYVPATADHGARAELRGDRPEGVPTQLIFQIECERSARTLTFRYHYDEREFSAPYPESAPFELVINDDERSFVMRRRPGDPPAARQLALNAEIVAAVAAADELQLYAPNESGHPWLLGRAPALRQLVRECWGPRVG